MTTIVVVLSIFLQLTAAAWAIRLIRFTRERAAWYLISVALLLRAFRRIVSLYVMFVRDSGVGFDPALANRAQRLLSIFALSPVVQGVRHDL